MFVIKALFKKMKEKPIVSATGVFPCEHCGKLFDTKRKIKVHTNRVHNPQNTCDLCGRIFFSCLEIDVKEAQFTESQYSQA